MEPASLYRIWQKVILQASCLQFSGVKYVFVLSLRDTSKLELFEHY
jgi:hypothetical protein